MANQMPEQKLHPAEIMRMSVGAAIFVNHFLLMAQSEDGRYRRSIFPGDADLRILAQASKYIAEPLEGMRRHLLPLPGNYVKLVEVRQHFL